MAAIGGVITIKLLDWLKTVYVAKSTLISRSSSAIHVKNGLAYLRDAATLLAEASRYFAPSTV